MKERVGYCPTVSQYNGKLYCDTVGFRCDVGWKLYCNLRLLGSGVLQYRAVGWQGECVTIHLLYFERDKMLAGRKLLRDTRHCMVTAVA